MNNVIFNGEGPIMSGTWYNPSNGDSFTVADSFFQDNQYIVKTTDGRMLDYNFIQHYIKSDKPIEPQTPKLGNLKESNPLPKEVVELLEDSNDFQNDIIESDLDIIMGKPVQQPMIKQSNPDNIIIDKALSKKSNPNVDCFINWDVFPIKEIELLIDVMDVDIKDILEYYINKLDLNTIKESVKNSLELYINGKFELHQTETHTTPTTVATDSKNTLTDKKSKPKKQIKK
jgi:hypothetical protein